MKSIPAALNSHLQGETTTLAICWAIRKSTGAYIRGTEHDQNLTIDAIGSPTSELAGLYYAQANITGSDVRSTSDLSVDNMEVEGGTRRRDEVYLPDVTVQEIESGVLDLAPVTVFLCNWREPNAGQVILRRGTLGVFTRDSDGRYRTEVRGLAQMLSQNIGQTYGERCNVVRFGDARCKFDVESLRFAGTISSVTDRKNFVIELGAPPSLPNVANLSGEITFTSGLNAQFTRGVKRMVENGTTIEVELWEESPDDIEVGDTATGLPGCDRLYSTCQAYSNLVNFRGHGLYIPGALALMRGPQNPRCVNDT